MMKLRIAVLQLNPRIGQVAANIERANSILKAHGFTQSSQKKLDILVLPELAFTGTEEPYPFLLPSFFFTMKSNNWI